MSDRKIYPMTEEIYERCEKVFWEAFEERKRQIKEQEKQTDNSNENENDK